MPKASILNAKVKNEINKTKEMEFNVMNVKPFGTFNQKVPTKRRRKRRGKQKLGKRLGNYDL